MKPTKMGLYRDSADDIWIPNHQGEFFPIVITAGGHEFDVDEQGTDREGWWLEAYGPYELIYSVGADE